MINWINRSSSTPTSYWDAIFNTLVNPSGTNYGNRLVAFDADVPPSGVAETQWGAVISPSWYAPDATWMANAIKAYLNYYPSRYVVINEISANNATMIHDCALQMAGYSNRWGAYLVNGPNVNYAAYDAVLNAVLLNWGRVHVELYPKFHDYWNNGTTYSERDDWLDQTFFTGGSLNRLSWLIDKRNTFYPGRQIHPVFSASQLFLSSQDQAKNLRFLDRVLWLYVNRNSKKYRPFGMVANGGGADSYLWEQSNPPDAGTAHDQRDNEYATLWLRYFVNGLTTRNWSANPGDPYPLVAGV